MVSKKGLLVQVFIFFLDIALINAIFLLAFVIRYGFDIPEASFAPFEQIFPALTFLYILAFAFARVFRKRFKAYWQIFKSVCIGMAIGTLFAFTFLYVFRIKWTTFPSSVFVISLIIGIPIVAIANSFIYRLWGRVKKRIVVVGGKNDNLLIEKSPRLSLRRVNSIDDILKYKDIDEILVCEHIHSDSQLNLLISLLLRLKVEVYFEPEIYAELLSGKIEQENSLKFLATFLGKKTETEEFFIRALDILGSAAMFIAAIPVFILIAIMVKLSSEGPAFYKQERVGKDGKKFILYKFRSMLNDSEKEYGFVEAQENDPRITKVGRLLRKTRIDELPQLINIFKGDMSLVGPRPENCFRVNNHKALQGLRLAVKPGLTGLAQIRSAYDLHPSHKIKYDYIYIQRRSLWLNLYILVKTIPVVLLKKGT
jgi:lipopolysaccharide/colanic/teichoic acid biosynthesis glycosyltransferase